VLQGEAMYKVGIRHTALHGTLVPFWAKDARAVKVASNSRTVTYLGTVERLLSGFLGNSYQTDTHVLCTLTSCITVNYSVQLRLSITSAIRPIPSLEKRLKRASV
jgi:hypothetical protein